MHVIAGHETKAMQNNSGPRYKRSKLERRLNVDVLWSVALLLIMCFVAAVGQQTIEIRRRNGITSITNEEIATQFGLVCVKYLSGSVANMNFP